ncbi:LysM domain-containing protein [Mobilisporobacter senegalensis]|uniref:LysM domain-containing protein n=1 Tax=Mobilisporobacter senegalensis TaxID=1329262 RepID=A0A3N1XA14_9FIRM|nr:LysM domain-containing protein [Mobilisporobacter senegalensis]ROR23610.1 LysM domain-containing protein [Mobilisporobacter senegalensis]
MIESIYSNEKKGEKNWNNSNIMFRMPKNIRQIGQPDNSRKIYIEDYVMTYVRQLAMKDYSHYKVAVLLGQFIKIDGGKSIFISGAVEAIGVDIETQTAFTNEIWTNIYDDVKKYFDDVEIVGWYVSKPGMTLDTTDQLLKVHVDNFAGQDKALLMYDSIEKEEAFHVFNNNKLCRQSGYYIYYERNEEMQNYMVENKKANSIDAGYEDKAIKEIRHIIESKKENKPEKEQGNVVNLLYAASTVLAVVVLVIGATMLNNYDQMQKIEKTLNTISDYVIGEQKDLPIEEATQMEEEEEKEKVTEVETMSGEIDKLKEEYEKENDSSKKTSEESTASKVDEEKDSSKDTTKDSNESTKKEEESKEDTSQDKETNEKKEEKETTSKQTTAKPKYHTIKSGDSLISISMKYYKTSDYVDEIMAANNIEDQDKILIGQKIRLP